MLNVARGVLISAALIWVCWWALQGSPTFQTCIQQDQKQAANNQPENYIAAFGARAGVYRDCLGDFVHDRKDEILVAFTIILAFSTIFLWVATRDLVSGAEKTARSQLRAYIGIAKARITVLRIGANPEIELHVTNFGQTPAYEFSYFVSFAFGTAVSVPRDNHDTMVVNPSEERFFRIGSDCPLTADAYAGIMDDTNPIVISGELHYRDVFDRRQICSFRFQTDSEFIHREQRLMISPGGNHST